jgi:DNA-binding response OmpR family regulator
MKEHILVVDDEFSIRYSLTYALRKVGYEVSLAQDGEEALALILKKHRIAESFDLLLTDIQMPNMNGIELIRELQRGKISLPTLVYSGVMDEKLMSQIVANGCSNYLIKSSNLLELVRKVRLVLDETRTVKNKIFHSALVSGTVS